jgi:hypothetical protein
VAAAPGGVVPPRFTTSLGSTFQFLTTTNTQDGAEKACQATGGHLAVYTDLTEQQEVERYYSQVPASTARLPWGRRQGALRAIGTDGSGR